MSIIIGVTNDEYELIKYMFDSAKEASIMLGIKYNSICKAIQNGNVNKRYNCKFIKIQI